MKKEKDIRDWFIQRGNNSGQTLHLYGIDSTGQFIKSSRIIRLDFEAKTVETENTIYHLKNPIG